MTLHGEFKTPGGKLIAVEFDVDDGILRNVVVTGDFFLYPEEALPLLSGALEGSPISFVAADYASKVQAALTGGVELLGSSPQALGAAVVRALEHSSTAGTGDDH